MALLAEAFAKRYPYLQFYTPINEIFIAAMFSGQYGWWNEYKYEFRNKNKGMAYEADVINNLEVIGDRVH